MVCQRKVQQPHPVEKGQKSQKGADSGKGHDRQDRAHQCVHDLRVLHQLIRICHSRGRKVLDKGKHILRQRRIAQNGDHGAANNTHSQTEHHHQQQLQQKQLQHRPQMPKTNRQGIGAGSLTAEHLQGNKEQRDLPKGLGDRVDGTQDRLKGLQQRPGTDPVQTGGAHDPLLQQKAQQVHQQGRTGDHSNVDSKQLTGWLKGCRQSVPCVGFQCTGVSKLHASSPGFSSVSSWVASVVSSDSSSVASSVSSAASSAARAAASAARWFTNNSAGSW